MKILRFFPKACTHIFKNYNFRLPGFQIEAFQQRYSKCKCETPYFESEFIPKTCKNWKMSSKNFFLSGLDQNKLKLYVFEMNFMTNQLKLTVPKKCGFRSWKGSNIWTLIYTVPQGVYGEYIYRVSSLWEQKWICWDWYCLFTKTQGKAKVLILVQ